jgi:hypothetical protein
METAIREYVKLKVGVEQEITQNPTKTILQSVDRRA